MPATRLNLETLMRKVRARSLWRSACSEARSRMGDTPRPALPAGPVVSTRTRT